MTMRYLGWFLVPVALTVLVVSTVSVVTIVLVNVLTV